MDCASFDIVGLYRKSVSVYTLQQTIFISHQGLSVKGERSVKIVWGFLAFTVGLTYASRARFRGPPVSDLTSIG